MYLLTAIVLLLISQFVSFLNGAVSELTQDIYNRLDAPQYSKKISRIWDKYDEIYNSLLFIYIITALFAIFLVGMSDVYHSNFHSNSIIPILIASFFIILLLVIISFTSYFLGKRFCAKTLSRFVTFIYIITAPLVPLIKKFTFLYLRISGKENDDVSMEEITDLVEEAREDGSIDAGEYRLLKNVMNFNDILVSDVMTPRTVLFSLQSNMTVEETAKLPELQMFSRFPVWNGESIDDEVVGYVMTKEVFNSALNGQKDKLLSELARPINFIPESAELGNTLEELLLKKQQLLLVVDEYGGIEGIITMEDVLETMLGVEIVDEADKVVDLRILAKQRRESRIKENYNTYPEE